MTEETKRSPLRPARLNKKSVILAAIKTADLIGIESLSMRKLGRELGVEGMALYHHVTNKSQLIEEMVDYIHSGIKSPLNALHWRVFMQKRAMSTLQVVAQHPWVAGLMESGVNPGSATLKNSDTMIQCFREAGFSIAMTVHSVTLLNIYIYGAAQQYVMIPFSTPDEAAKVSESIMDHFPIDAYPYLSEMISQHMMRGEYSAMDEFLFGLNLILDGIAVLQGDTHD